MIPCLLFIIDYALFLISFFLTSYVLCNIFFFLHALPLFHISYFLFITDYLLKRWAREIGFNQLNLVSKNLESNIGDIVVNDIKYGAKKTDLAKKVSVYKDLLVEVQEYFESKQEEYQKNLSLKILLM